MSDCPAPAPLPVHPQLLRAKEDYAIGKMVKQRLQFLNTARLALNKADELSQWLMDRGILLEDGSAGTTWKREKHVGRDTSEVKNGLEAKATLQAENAPLAPRSGGDREPESVERPPVLLPCAPAEVPEHA